MMRIIERAVERASRLPCRYSYRHSSKNAGKDADVAAWKAALRIDPDDRPGGDRGQFLRRSTQWGMLRYVTLNSSLNP
ncbi:MAG: hypothetical protein ABSF25_19885 [Bryobacteraceae bacterium]|jgi:hypothetical protein